MIKDHGELLLILLALLVVLTFCDKCHSYDIIHIDENTSAICYDHLIEGGACYQDHISNILDDTNYIHNEAIESLEEGSQMRYDAPDFTYESIIDEGEL